MEQEEMTKEDATRQLEAIKMLHHTIYILVRVLHMMWDSPYLEDDVRHFVMGLYGEVGSSIFMPTHRVMTALEMEYEVIWDGDPREVGKDYEDEGGEIE